MFRYFLIIFYYCFLEFTVVKEHTLCGLILLVLLRFVVWPGIWPSARNAQGHLKTCILLLDGEFYTFQQYPVG